MVASIVFSIVVEGDYWVHVSIYRGGEMENIIHTRVKLLERIDLLLAGCLHICAQRAGSLYSGRADIDALALLDRAEVDGIDLAAGIRDHRRFHVSE